MSNRYEPIDYAIAMSERIFNKMVVRVRARRGSRQRGKRC